MKGIEKIKNRVKFELEVTVKTINSKDVEIVSVMEEIKLVVKNIGIK